jgi:nucleoside-triphosphatase THEP1
MVYIIIGAVNSGKTSKMLEIYQKCAPEKAGGFISRKLFRGQTFLGYEIVKLPDGPCRILALLNSEYARNFSDPLQFGQFIFSREAFLFGESIISQLLVCDNVKDIYIDEIGPLELQGRGFCNILKKALGTNGNLYICVRNNCLKNFLDCFKISKYELISIN